MATFCRTSRSSGNICFTSGDKRDQRGQERAGRSEEDNVNVRWEVSDCPYKEDAAVGGNLCSEESQDSELRGRNRRVCSRDDIWRRVRWQTCWDQGKDVCQHFPFTSIQGRYSKCLPLPLGGIIMHVPQMVLLLGLLLSSGAHLSNGQHWSHGWYPGGKRDLDSFSPSEVRMGICVFAIWYVESCSVYLIDSDWNLCILSQISEEIKLCEVGECSYLRPQRRNVLRNILVRDLNLI